MLVAGIANIGAGKTVLKHGPGHSRESEKSEVLLEAIAYGELCIWGCHIGKAGSMNDLNILDKSPLDNGILGRHLLPKFEYEVNGKKLTCHDFLVDGIYPHWAIFVSTIAEGTNQKKKLFTAAQELLRKDVEQACGVFVSNCALLSKACTLWDRDAIPKTVKVAIISAT